MPKLSGLPPDTNPLVSDIIPMVDNTAVVTKKVLLSDLITTIFNNAPAVASSGWNTMSQAFTYGANNGNKEFTVTTPNDVTGLLWPGMRMKFNRGTTPPTQSMAFTAASSQYATKTTPTGVSFTGSYTTEVWVYLNSYPSSYGYLQNRENGGSGTWQLRVLSTGQLDFGYGDGSGNFTTFTSYQSLPLRQWVHIAGVVTSVASQTGIAYINSLVASSFTSAAQTTSLVQSGNISIGARANSNDRFLDGYVSEARVWSNAQSQAQIQANMTKNLVGNEANLVGLWQGNGNFNDLTTNANNLTATGGAIATQAANPYSSTEYGIVTKVSYVNPTTTITLFTGQSNTIPNMTLSSPQYSAVRAPYGFPAAKTNWQVSWLANTVLGLIGINNTWGTGSTTASTGLSIPTGEWEVTYDFNHYDDRGTNILIDLMQSLSTNPSAESDAGWTTRSRAGIGTGATYLGVSAHRTRPLSLSAQTIYYGLFAVNASDDIVSNHSLYATGG